MIKVLYILYALLAYLISVIVTLYAIGFIGDIIVPYTIDSLSTSKDWRLSALTDIILISMFALQHSVMARPRFKTYITTFIHPAIERATYVLSSSVALGLLCWFWQPINFEIWSVDNLTVSTILHTCYAIGWATAFLSSYMINHFELFGIKQVIDNYKNKPVEETSFQVRYLYNFIRHPLMLGFIIAFWCTPHMSAGRLLFAVFTTIYIMAAVKYLEEKELREKLGEQYLQYQKKVPMIFPFLK